MSYYGAGESAPLTKSVTDALLAPYRDQVAKLTQQKRKLQAYTGIAALVAVLMARAGRRA